MRILHTSDWHIGHKLYERSRTEEHRQFLEWLLKVVKEEEVDLLLVSGDIFDSALPSAESVDLYYQFLFRLYEETDASAIIIAGNHDSAVRLSAPRQFLEMARIHVIGRLPEQVSECIVKTDDGLRVIALPYVPEGEILSHVSFESKVDVTIRYRKAIKKLYSQCLSEIRSSETCFAHCAEQALLRPVILMGHFTVFGGEKSGSERAIQIGETDEIGGTQSIRSTDLPEGLCYAALGHLHRPQRIENTEYPVVYSGSPLPMTFKEATYDKKLYMLNLENKTVKITEIDVPVFKQLERVSGTYADLMLKANFENWTGKYIEVKLKLDSPRVGVGDEIRKAFADGGGEVLVVEAQLTSQKTGDFFSADELKEKSPEEIFVEFYKQEYGGENDEELSELMETFKKLIALVNSDE